MIKNLISVLVAVYNTEPYLQRCLDSIKRQTYDFFEVIIVDDGSTDNSLKIAEDYSHIDDRFHVIHKENGGLATARNEGIIHSKGEFICFIDSDDFLEDDYLQELFLGITSMNADVAVSAYYKGISEDKVIIEKYPGESKLLREDAMKSIYLFNSFGAYSWNKLFRSKIILQNQLFFDEELRMSQDLLWTTLYFKKISKCIYIKKPLYHYQYSSTSISKISKNNRTFNKKFLTSLLAHTKTLEAVSDEPEAIKKAFDCRYVNTQLRLLYNMAYSKFWDKEMVTSAQNAIRARLKTFISSPAYSVTHKLAVIIAALSPRLFGSIVVLFKK